MNFNSGLLTALLCACMSTTVQSQTQPNVSFQQTQIEGLISRLDATNIDTVFSVIFNRLPDSVFVYPTENYYYFQYQTGGKWYWGNIRLGVEDRDSGFINFNYWDYVDDPKTPDESTSRSKKYGAEQGVTVERMRELCYRITAFGKTVIFQLNPIGAAPPALFTLAKDERFVMRTMDESGYPFFLIFKSTYPHFMWVLNEERAIPGTLDSLTDELLIDKLSGFVFYRDRERSDRKILIGVWARNVRRNNYWDGPFDQLADNFTPDFFKDVIEQTYPYTRGRIDGHGIFIDQHASRLAISPYLDYETIEDLIATLAECHKQSPDEFFPCITYDYKVHMK